MNQNPTSAFSAYPAFPKISIKGRPVEYKTFTFQVKSIDEDRGTITGYLSTFGNIDLQKDRVLSGAFKKTLAEAYARKANGRTYLFALLWMHDPEQPIGGFLEATEDNQGLLVTAELDISVNAAGIPNNPIATRVFSGFKMGYIDEMSMGYLAIQKEYDGGVRNLKEVALLEGSAITMLMAANPEALVPASGVKTKTMNVFATKGASGKTSWPLADRTLAWDNGRAHNAIVEKATKDDGTLDVALMKSVHFWVDDSAPDNITSYKFLFCDVIDGEIKAIPRAIFACVGGHGLAVADIPEADVAGVQKKISAYYTRMRKEFDDDSIVPPWESDGKRGRSGRQSKDFNEVHQAGRAADCLEDWGDLLDDLTETMFQIFGMADSPEGDMADCLAQFGEALLKEWLPKAIEADLGQYLNDRGYCPDSPGGLYVPSSLRMGGDYDYGWMARRGQPDRKEGRVISAATQEHLTRHQAEMKALMAAHTSASDELASQFKSMVADHMAEMEQKVSDLTNLWADEGQGQPYSTEKPDGSVPNHNPPGEDGKSVGRQARREPRSSSSRNPSLPRTEKRQPLRAQPPQAARAGMDSLLSDLDLDLSLDALLDTL